MSKYINEMLEPLREVYQVSAGNVIYPPKGRYGPRLQTDYQLVLLDSGEMTVTINNEDIIIIPPGHVTLLVPGHMEYFTFSDEQETHHRWISTTMISKNKLTIPSLEKRLFQRPRYLPISEEINKLVDIIFNLQRDGINGKSSATCSLGWAATMLYLEEGRKFKKERMPTPH
jgi:AraC family transcriptional regulator, arabinose operon regulatory protein